VTGGTIRRGDIVLIEFPHSNMAQTVVRPALVISNDEHNASDPDVVCVMISSQVDKAREDDIVLTSTDADFRPSGLHVDSVFRVSRIQALERSIVRKRLGHVSDDFLAEIGKAIAGLLKL
jgi:mRNA interferase MazF